MYRLQYGYLGVSGKAHQALESQQGLVVAGLNPLQCCQQIRQTPVSRQGQAEAGDAVERAGIGLHTDNGGGAQPAFEAQGRSGRIRAQVRQPLHLGLAMGHRLTGRSRIELGQSLRQCLLLRGAAPIRLADQQGIGQGDLLEGLRLGG